MSPTSITLPLDAVATLPIILLDQFGRPYPPDAAAVLSSGDPTVFSAAIGVAADGAPAAVVTPIAVGSATLSFTDDVATVSLPVVVSVAAPSSASFGDPSFAPKS